MTHIWSFSKTHGFAFIRSSSVYWSKLDPETIFVLLLIVQQRLSQQKDILDQITRYTA